MKKIPILFMFSFVIASFSSCMVSRTDSNRVAMEKNKEKLSKDQRCDAGFAVEAANGEMYVSRLSQLALTNAASEDVKTLATKLSESHTASYGKLQAIATAKKISLPDKLSDRSQKSLDKMSRKKGKDFDKAYLKCMTHEHKGGIYFVKKEARKGKDAELKAWAADKVPVLEQYKEEIEKTCEKVK